MPRPPPPMPPEDSSWRFLPMPKMTPLPSPPSWDRTDGSPAEPLPRPWKSGGVGFGLIDPHAASASAPASVTAARESRTDLYCMVIVC